MYGIFMESVVIFKNYAGSRYIMVLFLLALVYLLIMEKDKRKRALFVYMPLSLLLLFFFPLFRKVFVRLMSGSGDTYYRVLWLIPMGVIIAYGSMKVAGSLEEKLGVWARRGATAVMAIAIMICGKYVYASPYMSPAENLYHIPQKVIDICDLMAPKEGEERIWAVFPTDLVYFVRQYDTDIQLLYGREMVEPKWSYYDPVHEVMNHPTVIKLEALLELTREKHCTYLVLPHNKKISGNPNELGLELLDTIEGYPVYYDPVAAKKMEETFG